MKIYLINYIITEYSKEKLTYEGYLDEDLIGLDTSYAPLISAKEGLNIKDVLVDVNDIINGKYDDGY